MRRIQDDTQWTERRDEMRRQSNTRRGSGKETSERGAFRVPGEGLKKGRLYKTLLLYEYEADLATCNEIQGYNYYVLNDTLRIIVIDIRRTAPCSPSKKRKSNSSNWVPDEISNIREKIIKQNQNLSISWPQEGPSMTLIGGRRRTCSFEPLLLPRKEHH